MPTSALGEYLRSELYDSWARNRTKVQDKWIKNEDAFNGVSRGVWKIEEGADWRSKTFIMATKIKVLTAYSIVIDMLLQGGTIPFALAASPWDLVMFEDMPPEQSAVVNDQIDDMTQLIRQQILDCKGDRELMKCVMSAAKFGETYFKTFVHEVTRKGFQQIDMAQGLRVQNPQEYIRHQYFEKKIKAPAFQCAPVWDMFRDMETDDMQEGRGVIQRTFTSAWALRNLKGSGGEAPYIDEAIDRAIKNNIRTASTKSTETIKPSQRDAKDRYNTFEKLEFWGRVPRKVLEQFENNKTHDFPDLLDVENDGDEVECLVCMADDEVIRTFRLNENTRPYGRVVWEVNLDDNFGIGEADNMESVQMPLNGMWRALEDNSKLAANIIVAIKKSLIQDWSGEFKPGEPIEITEEAKTAQEAIQQIIIQNVGTTLLPAIATLERYADEVSMLPKIMQGSVAEKQKPDTLGEISILQANAGKYIGSVIKNFDEGLIETVIERFYHYNMLDDKVQKGKGNYIAKAMGFSGYQDKVVRLQKILQALNIALTSPVAMAETRIRKLLEVVYKSLDFDPDELLKTKKEKDEDMQAQAQAQQQAADSAFMLFMGQTKAKMEADINKEVQKIQEQHKAKLEQMEVEHRNKLKQIDAESENRIMEDRAAAIGQPAEGAVQ